MSRELFPEVRYFYTNCYWSSISYQPNWWRYSVCVSSNVVIITMRFCFRGQANSRVVKTSSCETPRWSRTNNEMMKKTLIKLWFFTFFPSLPHSQFISELTINCPSFNFRWLKQGPPLSSQLFFLCELIITLITYQGPYDSPYDFSL